MPVTHISESLNFVWNPTPTPESRYDARQRRQARRSRRISDIRTARRGIVGTQGQNPAGIRRIERRLHLGSVLAKENYDNPKYRSGLQTVHRRDVYKNPLQALRPDEDVRRGGPRYLPGGPAGARAPGFYRSGIVPTQQRISAAGKASLIRTVGSGTKDRREEGTTGNPRLTIRRPGQEHIEMDPRDFRRSKYLVARAEGTTIMDDPTKPAPTKENVLQKSAVKGTSSPKGTRARSIEDTTVKTLGQIRTGRVKVSDRQRVSSLNKLKEYKKETGRDLFDPADLPALGLMPGRKKKYSEAIDDDWTVGQLLAASITA